MFLHNYVNWYKRCFNHKLLLDPTKNVVGKVISAIQGKITPQSGWLAISDNDIIESLNRKNPHLCQKAPQEPLSLQEFKKIIHRRRNANHPLDDLINGNIERVNREEVSGWFFCPNLPAFKGTLKIIHQDMSLEIARGLADQIRQDVQEAGIGDGSYGFNIPLPTDWDEGKGLCPDGLRVIVEELDLDLNEIFKPRHSEVSPKYWHNINNSFTLEPAKGVWLDRENEWAWIAPEAEFSLTAQATGRLVFSLIMPEGDMHKQSMPMTVKVFADGYLVFDKSIHQAGHHEITSTVDLGETVQFSVTCEKCVIPDEYCGNKDRRELSLVVSHFGVLKEDR